MQDDNELQNKNKEILLKTIGNVIHKERIKLGKGINLFSYEYDIGNGLLSKLEKGLADTKITTLWKIANAFGYSGGEFIKKIEQELPLDFDFYD